MTIVLNNDSTVQIV